MAAVFPPHKQSYFISMTDRGRRIQSCVTKLRVGPNEHKVTEKPMVLP